jgi:hypothetical protein
MVSAAQRRGEMKSGRAAVSDQAQAPQHTGARTRRRAGAKRRQAGGGRKRQGAKAAESLSR